MTFYKLHNMYFARIAINGIIYQDIEGGEYYI